MRILIIEDEATAARRLERMILEILPHAQVVETIETVTDAVAWLNLNPEPGLIFADIHLADGSCFEIFKRVKISSPVIFVTAYDQYAIEAFKINSIDYLLKPVKREDLERSIAKLNSLTQAGNLNLLLDRFLKKQQVWQTRFIVKSGLYFKTIEQHNISLFYAEDKVVFLLSTDQKTFAIDQTLDKLSQVLDPALFFRINRSCIISLHEVNKVSTYTKGRMKIEKKIAGFNDLIVPANKVQNFKLWLEGRLVPENQ